MMKSEYVKVEHVIREIEFQKQEMIKYMRQWKVDESVIEMATDSFDDAIHGIDSHLRHIEVEENE